MGKYVKISCPKCNYVLHPWHLNNSYGMVDIGIPFEQCPNCGTLLAKKNIKEFTMLSTLDYIRMWFWNILSGVVLCAIGTGIFCIIILEIFNINDLKESFIFMIFLILIILFLRQCYKTQQKQIYDSKQRLKNLNYAKLIDSLNQNSKFNILHKSENSNKQNDDLDNSINLMQQTINNAKRDLETGVKKEQLDEMLKKGYITQESYDEVLKSIKILEMLANFDIDELKKGKNNITNNENNYDVENNDNDEYDEDLEDMYSNDEEN